MGSRKNFSSMCCTGLKQEEPFHLFLTGGAAVGKSVVVRALYQALTRHLCSESGEDQED